MNNKQMKETLHKLEKTGHFVHSPLWVHFYLNEKETQKVNNIRNGITKRYKQVLVDESPLYLIKKIGKDNGRACPEDGHYLYMDDTGTYFYKYVDKWCNTIIPLVTLQNEHDYGIITKSYYKGVIQDHIRGYGIHIDYFEPQNLTDIEGRLVEVGDTVLAAKSGYNSSSACLLKGVVTKINPTEVNLDTENHVRSSLYILKKKGETI